MLEIKHYCVLMCDTWHVTLSVIGLWPGEDQVDRRLYTVADSLNTWHVVTGDSAGGMFEKKLRTHGMLLCRHDNIFISETLNGAGDVSM